MRQARQSTQLAWFVMAQFDPDDDLSIAAMSDEEWSDLQCAAVEVLGGVVKQIREAERIVDAAWNRAPAGGDDG